MFSVSDDLPPDPFRTGVSGLAEFAANSYSMYTSLIGAGFTEMQALEFTIRVTTHMIAVSAPAPKENDDGA